MTDLVSWSDVDLYLLALTILVVEELRMLNER